jgi:hypothetical protein
MQQAPDSFRRPLRSTTSGGLSKDKIINEIIHCWKVGGEERTLIWQPVESSLAESVDSELERTAEGKYR